MSSSGSIPPPPPSTSPSPENMYGGNITIQTNDTTELENINKMIKSTYNKRDDGIELIINTDDENERKDEEKDNENEIEQGEKKIIKMN